MDAFPPTKTPRVIQWVETGDASERVRRALLSSSDGHRNVIELERFAQAMGLAPDALERLRGEGLVDLSP